MSSSGSESPPPPPPPSLPPNTQQEVLNLNPHSLQSSNVPNMMPSTAPMATPLTTATQMTSAAQYKPVASDFELFHVVGEGAYAKVYFSQNSKIGSFYAMKVVDKDHVTRVNKIESITTERNVLSTLKGHPGIVHLTYTLQDNYSLYFALEFCHGGELYDQIKHFHQLPLETVRFYAAELAETLHFMHLKQIIHRDLKPSNILITESGHIKVCDFGTAKILTGSEPPIPSKLIDQLNRKDNGDDGSGDKGGENHDEAFDFDAALNERNNSNNRKESFVGTAYYCYPEMLSSHYLTYGADWWSFGIILYEMLTGTTPFKGESEYLTFQKIQQCDPIYFPENFDPMAKDLIEKLLHPDPRKRLGTLYEHERDIFQHQFFKPVWNLCRTEAVKRVQKKELNEINAEQHSQNQSYSMHTRASVMPMSGEAHAAMMGKRMSTVTAEPGSEEYRQLLKTTKPLSIFSLESPPYWINSEIVDANKKIINAYREKKLSQVSTGMTPLAQPQVQTNHTNTAILTPLSPIQLQPSSSNNPPTFSLSPNGSSPSNGSSQGSPVARPVVISTSTPPPLVPLPVNSNIVNSLRPSNHQLQRQSVILSPRGSVTPTQQLGVLALNVQGSNNEGILVQPSTPSSHNSHNSLLQPIILPILNPDQTTPPQHSNSLNGSVNGQNSNQHLATQNASSGDGSAQNGQNGPNNAQNGPNGQNTAQNGTNPSPKAPTRFQYGGYEDSSSDDELIMKNDEAFDLDDEEDDMKADFGLPIGRSASNLAALRSPDGNRLGVPTQSILNPASSILSAVVGGPEYKQYLTTLSQDPQFQQAKWEAHLRPGEHIVAIGLIVKNSRWSSTFFVKKRQLVLTSQCRLVYIDGEKNVLKGEIPIVGDGFGLKIIDPKNFEITSTHENNRVYKIQCQQPPTVACWYVRPHRDQAPIPLPPGEAPEVMEKRNYLYCTEGRFSDHWRWVIETALQFQKQGGILKRTGEIYQRQQHLEQHLGLTSGSPGSTTSTLVPVSPSLPSSASSLGAIQGSNTTHTSHTSSLRSPNPDSTTTTRVSSSALKQDERDRDRDRDREGKHRTSGRHDSRHDSGRASTRPSDRPKASQSRPQGGARGSLRQQVDAQKAAGLNLPTGK